MARRSAAARRRRAAAATRAALSSLPLRLTPQPRKSVNTRARGDHLWPEAYPYAGDAPAERHDAPQDAPIEPHEARRTEMVVLPSEDWLDPAESDSPVLSTPLRQLHSSARRRAGDGLDDVWPGEPGGVTSSSDAVRMAISGVSGAVEDWLTGTVRRLRWLIGIVGIAVVVILVASSLAYADILHGVHEWPARTTIIPPVQPTQALVLHGAPAVRTPTPAVAPYLVGAWVANSTPPSSGGMNVYVSVRDSSMSPVPGAKVSVDMVVTCDSEAQTTTFGPVTTQANGIATVPITFGGLPYAQPVCVNVTAVVGTATYTATTEFAPQ